MKGTTKGVLLKRMGRRKLCVRRNLFRRIEFRCLTGPKRKMCTSWVAMWHGRWSESSEVQAGKGLEATDRPCQPPCHWPGCPCLTPHLDSRLHRNHVIIPEDVLRRFLSLPLSPPEVELEMSRWNLAWLLGIPAVALLSLTLSYSAPQREKDKDYEMVRLLVDVLDEVDRNYVKELDTDAKRKLVEDMINGGLEHLDPHSNFMNPKEYKFFNTQSKGKFGGVGIQISTDPQSRQLTVISPMVGTPAFDAGVLAGDMIVKIDGKATENMRLSEAVDMIQG